MNKTKKTRIYTAEVKHVARSSDWKRKVYSCHRRDDGTYSYSVSEF